MTTSGPQPEDLETIAAFIDQRLSTEEREEFMTRLDREEALYEVFVETVRYRDEASDEPARVVRHPASWRTWALPAAAAAVLLTAVVTGVGLVGRGNSSYAERLVADGALAERLGEGWYEQEWPVTRGARPSAETRSAAFRLGVRVVDLEVALLTGREEAASLLTFRLEALLESLDRAAPLQAAYADLRAEIGRRAPAAELVQRAQETDSLTTDFLPDLNADFELGKWVEAGRLAALDGNTGFLRSLAFRRRLDRLRREDWRPEVQEELDKVARELARRDEAVDLQAINESFAAVIASN